MHAVLRRNQTEFLRIFLENGAPVDAQNVLSSGAIKKWRQPGGGKKLTL